MWWPWRARAAGPAPAQTDARTPSPDRLPREQWRTLPALQRTMYEQEFASHLDTFPASLSTRQDPRFLAPLGHYLEPSGPAGEVAGLAVPATPASSEYAAPRGRAADAIPTTVSPVVQRSAAPFAVDPSIPSAPLVEPPTPPSDPPSTIGQPASSTRALPAPPAAPAPPQPSIQRTHDVQVPEPAPSSTETARQDQRLDDQPRDGARSEPFAPDPPAGPTTLTPTLGLNEDAGDAGPPSPSPAETFPSPVQRVVAVAALPSAVREPTPTRPSALSVASAPVVLRSTDPAPPTPADHGALAAVSGRPVPDAPRALAPPTAAPVQRTVEATVQPRDPAPLQPPSIAPASLPSQEPTSPSIDLVGDRPLQVERPTPLAAPHPPAVQRVSISPQAPPAATTTSNAVNRPVEAPSLDPPHSPVAQRVPEPVQSRAITSPGVPVRQPVPSLAVQRIDSAVPPARSAGPLPHPDAVGPLPQAPPPPEWSPRTALGQPIVRPVPAPPLEPQAVTSAPASSAPPAVQRVLAEPVGSVAPFGLPEPAVAPTRLVVTAGHHAPPVTAAPGATRGAPPAPTAQRVPWSVQRAPATAPAVAGTRPLTRSTVRAPAADAMPTGIRSMPLQRLFSAATSQVVRSEPNARSSGLAAPHAVPGKALPEDLGLATGEEQQPHLQAWAQPTLQRAEEADPADPADPASAPPPEEGVVAATPGPASPSPAKPGPDMDELARRLYGPMSALLRAELWLDRERSGRSLTR